MCMRNSFLYQKYLNQRQILEGTWLERMLQKIGMASTYNKECMVQINEFNPIQTRSLHISANQFHHYQFNLRLNNCRETFDDQTRLNRLSQMQIFFPCQITPAMHPMIQPKLRKILALELHLVWIKRTNSRKLLQQLPKTLMKLTKAQRTI